jgi:hypothetical protein
VSPSPLLLRRERCVHCATVLQFPAFARFVQCPVCPQAMRFAPPPPPPSSASSSSSTTAAATAAALLAGEIARPLTVRSVYGHDLRVYARPSNTVLQLKQRLSGLTGIAAADAEVFWTGHVQLSGSIAPLPDSSIFRSYDMDFDAVLYLVRKSDAELVR